jgi:hypothetical protein
MKLNIINNYKVIYYNFIVNFYLIINTFVPLYDDVIISMYNEAAKQLYKNVKYVKKNRILDVIKDLKDNDKILYDNVKNIISIEYNYEDYMSSSDNYDNKDYNSSDTDNDANNEIKEIIKKKIS